MVGSKGKKVDLEDTLNIWFSGARRVIIVGIGNSFRKDDFVGVKIVRNLQNKVFQSVYLIEGETVPENFLDSIIEVNPTHILVIDAGLLNLNPGSSRLIESNQITNQFAISTHLLPLRVFCDYLVETTGAKLSLLVVQPEDTSFGEGLTPKLRETEKNLTNLLLKFLS